jgi:hypothetical protein
MKMLNKAKYQDGERVKVIRVFDDCGYEKFPEFNQYIGKFGNIIQSHKIGFGGIPGTNKVELPDSSFIYTVTINNNKIEMPEDILQSANW